jgi:hypothetical protein
MDLLTIFIRVSAFEVNYVNSQKQGQSGTSPFQ